MSVTRCMVKKVQANMKSAEDIFSENGDLLVPKGKLMTFKDVRLLDSYGITYISVERIPSNNPPSKEGPASAAASSGEAGEAAIVKDTLRVTDSSYSTGIKASDDFKTITRAYLNVVNAISLRIEHYIKSHDTATINSLLPQLKGFIDISPSPSSLLESLSCLRSYEDDIYIHSVNVALVSYVITRWMNLNQAQADLVILSAILHDIGKTQISPSILKKQSKLTQRELEIVRSHSLIGYNMLLDVNISNDVRLGVLQHHERCDGSGYPYGLLGESIGQISKILAIADVYDAMTSLRCYRNPLCPFDVLRTFEAEGFSKYGALELMSFYSGIADIYVGRMVLLSNDVIGKIVHTNRNDITRPLIETEHGTYINLSTQRDISIKSIL